MVWKGRTAVITGTARPAGIGQACATLLFKQGYNVIGIDKDPPTFELDAPWLSTASCAQAPISAAPGDCTATAVADRGPKVAWLTCDLSQPEEIFSLEGRIRDLGVTSVHVLVNNAGTPYPYLKAETLAQKAALWSQYIAVHLSAPFLLSEALLPLMAPGETSIIHMSSVRALMSEPHCEGYHSAKAGLLGLTHAQAATLSAKRIRVNAICPGMIDTSGQSEEASGITQEMRDWHWTGRVGRPDDVAELVCFLADNSKSAFITGQHFIVDGGISRKIGRPLVAETS